MKYLLGLIGHPVAHSLSPSIHCAALQYCGLEGSYELIDLLPGQLKEGIERLFESGFSGFNVTIPHKKAVFDLASERTPEALAANASNTIRILADGRLLAHNTDIEGFREALEQVLPLPAASCCILGTGGAAKAALLALAPTGPDQVIVLSRQMSTAAALVAEMQPQFPTPSHLVASTHLELRGDERFDLIVNCSPIGQNGLPLPVWIEEVIDRLDRDGLFFDMVYAKKEEVTPLVELVRKYDKRAVDGTEMLIRQARKSFQFWTGQSPPVEVFRAALSAAR